MPALTIDEIYTNLENSIRMYDEKQLPVDLRALNNKFAMELSFIIIIPAAATVLSSVFVNLAAGLAPLAVGAVNAVDKLALSKSLITTYGQDKQALQSRSTYLYMLLNSAKTTDDPDEQKSIIKDVRDTIKAWCQKPEMSAS